MDPFPRIVRYLVISLVCLGVQALVIHNLNWGWPHQMMAILGYVVFTQLYFVFCRVLIWRGRATTKGVVKTWFQFNIVMASMTVLRSVLNGQFSPPGVLSLTYATAVCGLLTFLFNNFLVFRKERESPSESSRV